MSVICVILGLLFTIDLSSQEDDVSGGDEAFLYHLEVKPKTGDGVLKLLSRYKLEQHSCNIAEFYRLNGLESGGEIYTHKNYRLPILIYRYNGQSIRSTIEDNDWEKAVRIQQYNSFLLTHDLRRTDYRDSRLLWVPYHEMHCLDRSTHIDPLLGSAYPIRKKNTDLAGRVIYLVAGHGGPDPGAMGQSSGHTLCEDEYAYDVILRLYRLILERGGHAEVIIQDPGDGIRDDQILSCDQDETCNGEALPLNQVARLKQRVTHINDRFRYHRAKGVSDQTCISIHVDSRAREHRQDVFFCHYGLSQGSESLARRLRSVFENKYKIHRASGQYAGTIESRNLFVLKNTMPKAVLIELGNIQNINDHKRLLLPSNRQALAQWICEGLQ